SRAEKQGVAGVGLPRNANDWRVDADRATDSSHADHAGQRAGPELPARGRARARAAHGPRRTGAGLLRASRAAVEVSQPSDRAASAQEGAEAQGVRRHAAAL